MEPSVAKKLMQDVPEMTDFVDYVKSKCLELNGLTDIDIASPIDLAVEVRGRQRAMEKLVSILHPLVTMQDFEPNDKKEFAVDIE